jgi:hypothetical protein
MGITLEAEKINVLAIMPKRGRFLVNPSYMITAQSE